MRYKFNLGLLLLIIVFPVTSWGFLAIPEGKVESKHSPTVSHDATNTKVTANSEKPFERYIADVAAMIENALDNSEGSSSDSENNVLSPIDAATPFQWEPGDRGGTCDKKNTKNVVLLIHGLTDTPFIMRDIGEYLNSEHCFLVRSILLPGHGTVPGDLVDEKFANHNDWIEASGYGINSFFNENENLGVENFYIVGFSTGGALALYHALYSTEKSEKFKKSFSKLRGLILLSPAIQVKQELAAKASNWHKLYSHFIPEGKWIDLAEDRDRAKYESFPKNAADQIHKLSNKVYCQENAIFWEIPEFKDSPILGQLFCSENIDRLKVPVFMAMSKEDETVNTDGAIEFFKKQDDQNSSFILYYANEDADHEVYEDERIRPLNISNAGNKAIIDFAHTSIPVSSENKYYGNHYGKIKVVEEPIYYNCVHYNSGNSDKDNKKKYGQCINHESKQDNIRYGETSDKNVDGYVLRRLTYNPQFARLTEQISQFINNTLVVQ